MNQIYLKRTQKTYATIQISHVTGELLKNILWDWLVESICKDSKHSLFWFEKIRHSVVVKLLNQDCVMSKEKHDNIEVTILASIYTAVAGPLVDFGPIAQKQGQRIVPKIGIKNLSGKKLTG